MLTHFLIKKEIFYLTLFIVAVLCMAGGRYYVVDESPMPVVNVDLGTRPPCEASIRGEQWFDAGGSGVADSITICAKSTLNVYAWHNMATIP